MAGGRDRDALAGLGRAGERDVVDARMLGECLAGFRSEPGHDVQRTGRKPDRGGERGDTQQRQAGVLGGLDDAGVARCERGPDRAPEDLHRIVPGHDVPGHAMRLADRQDRVAVLVGNRGAVQLVGGAGIELEVARQRDRVGPCLLQRLAGVLGLELRQLLDMGLDRIGPAPQQAAAIDGGHPAPEAGMGRARGRDGLIDVVGAAAGDLREHGAARRIDHRQRLAAARRDRLVADEMDEAHGVVQHDGPPVRAAGCAGRER